MPQHYRHILGFPALQRREFLSRVAHGFGTVALANLLSDGSLSNAFAGTSGDQGPLAPKPTHFPARAEHVIFLFMDGGPSQVDTFDPKPQLAKEDGQPFKMKVEQTQFDAVGRTLMSPWKFGQYGTNGIPISELFPHLQRCADELCVVRSMTSPFAEHTRANYWVHSGYSLQGRPSAGAWCVYGLGSECRSLPGFVVLNSGFIPPGGLDCFHSGFLPATFQGSIFKDSKVPVADIQSDEAVTLRDRKMSLLRHIDSATLEVTGPNDAIESAIRNYELAFRMQTAVPDLFDLDQETEATRRMYGLDAALPEKQLYARQCLLARRLVEQGVRFVEVTYMQPSGGRINRWDQHQNLKEGHELNAQITDQPIAALLTDLKARGLLEKTLIIWSGEFGRTPFAQGTGDGRDHHPHGFTIWLAGGGVRGGITYGETDEYGYRAVENRLEIFDLHATMLHLLGMDHTKLTFRHTGRDFRRTDVHGHVVHDILA
jgi:hypothetical protein